mmetsp:Transcript_13323/g.39676  ORF Transcript_13323/g.39676 Transcript_13323/m.39676 type:complete len:401 (-) Transcript_13323:33-1235(-)
MQALLCLVASAAALTPPARTARAASTRLNAWGEHIADVPGGDFLRNADGRPSQLTRDYGKLIITLATTGNINTRENNPTLPCSPAEMAADMHECIKLGVSVLHIHSRNELLKPTMRVDKFRETCRLVRESDPDVVIQISTGGRAPPTAFEGVDVGDWRMDPLNLLPEMGSYTPGSVNLGPIVYQNDAKLTRDMAQKYTDLGIKPQVEVFDTNMISNAYNLVKQGLLKRPLEFGFVMGAPNAQEYSLRQLGHLTSMLHPGDTWTAIGVGKFEMPLAYAAIANGGHVRVGLEDTNKHPDGSVTTNYELVKHVVEMAKAMGREIATPAEAREILSMDPAHITRIDAQLDPKVPVSSLVSSMKPYDDLVPVGGDSLEMKPTEAHPDYTSEPATRIEPAEFAASR